MLELAFLALGFGLGALFFSNRERWTRPSGPFCPLCASKACYGTIDDCQVVKKNVLDYYEGKTASHGLGNLGGAE